MTHDRSPNPPLTKTKNRTQSTSRTARAVIVFVAPHGRFALARSNEIDGKIYVPAEKLAPSLRKKLVVGLHFEAPLMPSEHGGHKVIGPIKPINHFLQETAQRKLLTFSAQLRSVLPETGALILVDRNCGKKIFVPRSVATKVAPSEISRFTTFKVSAFEIDGKLRAASITIDSTVNTHESIRSVLARAAKAGQQQLSKSWVQIISWARACQSRRSVALDIWRANPELRSPSLLPQLFSLLTPADAVAILRGLRPSDRSALKKSDWRKLWAHSLVSASVETLEALVEASAAENWSFAAGSDWVRAARLIEKHAREDLLVVVYSACKSADWPVTCGQLSQLALVAAQLRSSEAFSMVAAESSKREWSDHSELDRLVFAAICVGTKDQISLLLSRGRQTGVRLGVGAWRWIESEIARDSKSDRLVTVLDALVRSADRLTGDAWWKLASVAGRLGKPELLRLLIRTCATSGWNIDGIGFGTFAKACATARQRDLFTIVVDAAAERNWPLTPEAWITFATASISLRTGEALEKVARGALRHRADLKPAAWTTLIRAAYKLNRLEKLENIIASCASLGWPIEAAGWRSVIAAVVRLARLDLLLAAITSRLGATARISDEECRELLHALDVATRSTTAARPTTETEKLTALYRLLWQRMGSSWFSKWPNLYQALVQGADRLSDTALIEECYVAWEERAPTCSPGDIDLAAALALALAIHRRPNGIECARRVVRRIREACERCCPCPSIWLLEHYFDALEGLPRTPRFISADLDLAQIHFEHGDIEPITMALDLGRRQAFVENFDDYLRGQPLEEVLNNLEKLRLFRRIVSGGAEDEYVLVLLGKAHRRARNFAQALSAFATAEKANSEAKNKSVCAYEIGITYLDQGKPDKALHYLAKSIRLAPQPRNSQLSKAAEAAMLCGEFGRAIEWLTVITENDPDKRDDRAWLQLARTVALGVQRKVLPEQDLDRADKILCDLLVSPHGDVRTLRDAALLSAQILADRGVSVSTRLRNSILHLIATESRPDHLEAICDAVARYELWSAAIIDAAVTRLLLVWPDQRTARPLIRCVSAALGYAYHDGRLGDQTYAQGATSLFRRILEAPTQEKVLLIFEILVARRGYTLRKVLSDYARIAEQIVARFLLGSSTGQPTALTHDVLDDLNALLREQIPPSVEPTAYGGSDKVRLRPRLKKFAERLQVRAAMSANRGEVLSEASSDADAEGRHLDWIRVRSLISSLLPSATESPLAEIARVSVPWHLVLGCAPGTVTARVLFPSSIHPTHNPELILRNTEKALRTWVHHSSSRFSGIKLDRRNWYDKRELAITFKMTAPTVLAPVASALKEFVEFLTSESQRILDGGALSSTFFENAKALFVSGGGSELLRSAGTLAGLHQHIMDCHFAVTADWLFMGEGIAERPEYHPRYEVHTLKGYVTSALRQLANTGTIDKATLDALRGRLIRMRKNILQTLKQAVSDETGEETLTDVVGVINEVCEQFRVDGNKVEIVVLAPASLLARVGRFSLHSALFNVMVNAIEAILASRKKVEPRVTVKIEGEDTDVVITVSNQFDLEVAAKPYGTGIGLSDTRFHIEDLSGGQMSAEPTPDGEYVVRIVLGR